MIFYCAVDYVNQAAACGRNTVDRRGTIAWSAVRKAARPPTG